MVKRRGKGSGTLHKRADGMWIGQISYTDEAGIRRRPTVSSRNRNECADKLKELQRRIDDGLVPTTGKTTLTMWLDRWLDDIIAREVKPTTLKTYRTTAKTITGLIGTKRLDKLTPADVRKMIDGITASGRSTGTALSTYRVLAKALTDAVREGLIRSNPCDRVAPPRAVRESRGTLDIDNLRTLFASLAATDDPLTARWALSLLTGARQAECLGLEWDRVDFTAKTIDISWTLAWLPLKARYGRQPDDVNLYGRELFDVDPGFDFRPVWRTGCLIPPKTERSRRIVPMIAPLEAALRQHREVSPGEGLVFTREGGRPLRKQDDAKAWHATLATAGLPDMVLHSARHTVATLLQGAGVDEAVRMQILGHSSVAAQRGYAHVDQKLATAALGELGKLLA